MMVIYFLSLIILQAIPAFSYLTEIASHSFYLPTYEEINHGHFLVDDISNLHLKEKFSDVVLVVENERLYAHRVVLASRSEYFSNLFYGNYKEIHQRDIVIAKVPLTPFKILLGYIYTGRINLSSLEDEIIWELFIISHYFAFYNLHISLSEHLSRNINVDNACSLYAAANLYKLKKLEEETLNFIDSHATDVFQSKDFLTLSAEAIQQLLRRDSLIAYELDVFRAVSNWIQRKREDLDPDVKTNVLSAVRYPLMSIDELKSVVNDSQLVDPNTISDAIQFIKTMPLYEFKFRGRPNVNFAHSCEATSSVTDAVTIIKLDHPTTINYIEMNLYSMNMYLWYSDTGSYSYYIEVSMDQNDWVRVIDHSNYHCRSTQRLWIHPRIVQYIRVVGTYSTDKKAFRISEIKYNTNEMHTVDIENGFVAPKYNVTTISMDAAVFAQYRFTNILMLDGNFEYDFNYYKCPRLNSGCIVVQLAQPYMICSMRMVFWDEDDGELGFLIDVSVNNQDWEEIVDKTNEFITSCQVLQFKCRPIVYIRITGINDSVDNYFHCEELEAPVQVAVDPNAVEVNRDVASYEDNNETDILMSETITEAPVV